MRKSDRKAPGRNVVASAVLLIASAALAAGCAAPASETPREGATENRATAEVARGSALDRQVFAERAVDLGVDFVHDSGAAGAFHMPEILGSGAGLFDYDGDGLDDLYMTHIDGETNTLYRATGVGLFEDATFRSGLGAPSLASTGFATVWIDLDNDGWLDLLVTNGAVRLGSLGMGAKGSAVTVPGAAGPFFEVSAVGDLDDDGGPARVLIRSTA